MIELIRCPDCERKYRNQAALRMHRVWKHPEVGEEKKPLGYARGYRSAGPVVWPQTWCAYFRGNAGPVAFYEDLINNIRSRSWMMNMAEYGGPAPRRRRRVQKIREAA